MFVDITSQLSNWKLGTSTGTSYDLRPVFTKTMSLGPTMSLDQVTSVTSIVKRSCVQ